MEGTDLSECQLAGSKVSKITTDRATIWPTNSLLPFRIAFRPALLLGNVFGIVLYFAIAFIVDVNFFAAYGSGLILAFVIYMLAVRFSLLPAWNLD